MSTATTGLNPLLYIDKIQKLYPFGVSVSAITTPPADHSVGPASSEGRPVCILFSISDSGGDGQRVHDALLKAICDKGLNLTNDEYLVQHHRLSEFSQEVLTSQVKAHAPAVMIVFGGYEKPGTVTTFDSTRVLHAHPLARIAAELPIKKEFWKQLQESILPIVKER